MTSPVAPVKNTCMDVVSTRIRSNTSELAIPKTENVLSCPCTQTPDSQLVSLLDLLEEKSSSIPRDCRSLRLHGICIEQRKLARPESLWSRLLTQCVYIRQAIPIPSPFSAVHSLVSKRIKSKNISQQLSLQQTMISQGENLENELRNASVEKFFGLPVVQRFIRMVQRIWATLQIRKLDNY